MESVLAIAFPIIGIIAGSLITAWFLRRSSKESNATSAFDVVTTQLLAVNKEFREELNTVKKELSEVKTTLAVQGKELEQAKDERDTAKRVNAGLASYIKKLLTAWPTGSTPPSPDEPVNWEAHL